jgi:hypothetical protein
VVAEILTSKDEKGKSPDRAKTSKAAIKADFNDTGIKKRKMLKSKKKATK